MKFILDVSVLFSEAAANVLLETPEEVLISHTLVMNVLAGPSYLGAVADAKIASQEAKEQLSGIWTVSTRNVESVMRWMLEPAEVLLQETLVRAAQRSEEAIVQFRSGDPQSRLFNRLLQESIAIRCDRRSKSISIPARSIFREQMVSSLASHSPIICCSQNEPDSVRFLREAGAEIEEHPEASIARKQQVLISDERLGKAKGRLMEQGWRMQAIYINPLPPTLVLPRKALAFHLLSIKLTQL